MLAPHNPHINLSLLMSLKSNPDCSLGLDLVRRFVWELAGLLREFMRLGGARAQIGPREEAGRDSSLCLGCKF